MMRERLLRHGWLFPWLAVLATAYQFRSLIPIDETRYLSVAWEMWLRGDFLVPYMNGEPYSHKPPMLFWLFQAGWSVFGVNEWWPRLVPPLFALAGLSASQYMARKLWPDRPQIAILAPWILCSSLFWALYTSAVLFDMLLMLMVVIALLGMLRAASGKRLSGWLVVGIASGIGILVKGPVMLLHIAFPALLGPWWSRTARQQPLYWYGMLLGAILMAALIALAWALPAASAGGTAYEQAILWHQTADRMVSSFAHRRSFWWYLPLLPIMLAPWLIWPPLWRALVALRRDSDPGIRFLLSWLLPTFIAFCLVSGKQLHYLFPLFPAFALLAARALDTSAQTAGRLNQLLPAMFAAAVGVAMLALPHMPATKLPEWTQSITPGWGLALLVVAVAILVRGWQRGRDAVVALAVAGTGVAVLILGGISQASRPVYDLRPAALFISQLQQQGAPIANMDIYHAEFQFLGRLQRPLTELEGRQLHEWSQAHPDGYVVMYRRQAPAKDSNQPVYMQRLGDEWLTVWPVARMAGQS